ncbi:MAG: exosortase family protein XrtF [Flavobacterium sp.]|nr:MAG: exosortase family protein XrtF [Flavobacterium sp.]
MFLFKFFAVYAGLTLIYQIYLNQFNIAAFEVDDFTRFVSRQTKWFTQVFGYETLAESHPLQPSIMLTLNGRYVARVVEGCNALSVIILFVSFVVAFKGNFKNTILFIIGGSVLIHFLNVARIGLLAMALVKYPQYEHFLHGVVFPAVIYGIVFSLWVIWVNKFSVHGTKKD